MLSEQALETIRNNFPTLDWSTTGDNHPVYTFVKYGYILDNTGVRWETNMELEIQFFTEYVITLYHSPRQKYVTRRKTFQGMLDYVGFIVSYLTLVITTPDQLFENLTEIEDRRCKKQLNN